MDGAAARARDPLSNVRYRAPDLADTAIDYGMLPDLVGFSIKLAWLLGHGALSRELGEPITPHRFSVLEAIGRNPGLQQTQLADALALSRPATTLAINFWAERGCVERRDIPGDRRSFGIHATQQGEHELARLRLAVQRADAALTSGLTPKERQELHRLLRKIHC